MLLRRKPDDETPPGAEETGRPSEGEKERDERNTNSVCKEEGGTTQEGTSVEETTEGDVRDVEGRHEMAL